MKFAIVKSSFNTEIVDGLLKGAQLALSERGVSSGNIEIFSAPGAYELPLIAQELAKTARYAGIICLGCVIKGDTAHFEFISLGTTVGIQQASLATATPLSFGVITTYTEQQALDRSQPNSENKGREAALACFDTALTLTSIRTLR